jgi:hypothetical protein
VLVFTLKTPGPAVETLPDLGIDADDVKPVDGGIEVTVHSLGALPAPAGAVSVLDARGKVLASAPTPSLPAPTDLEPHTAVVKIALPAGTRDATVHVGLEGVKEITQLNNNAPLP